MQVVSYQVQPTSFVKFCGAVAALWSLFLNISEAVPDRTVIRTSGKVAWTCFKTRLILNPKLKGCASILCIGCAGFMNRPVSIIHACRIHRIRGLYSKGYEFVQCCQCTRYVYMHDMYGYWWLCSWRINGLRISHSVFRWPWASEQFQCYVVEMLSSSQGLNSLPCVCVSMPHGESQDGRWICMECICCSIYKLFTYTNGICLLFASMAHGCIMNMCTYLCWISTRMLSRHKFLAYSRTNKEKHV